MRHLEVMTAIRTYYSNMGVDPKWVEVSPNIYGEIAAELSWGLGNNAGYHGYTIGGVTINCSGSCTDDRIKLVGGTIGGDVICLLRPPAPMMAVGVPTVAYPAPSGLIPVVNNGFWGLVPSSGLLAANGAILQGSGLRIGQPDVPYRGPKCECGSDKACQPRHSSWCPKYC